MIDTVNEDNARVTGFPGHVHYFGKYLFGIEFPLDLFGAWIDKVVFRTCLDGFHKFSGYGHGDIKVSQGSRVIFCRYELHNIRVVNVKDTHICPTAHPPLFDDISGGIKGSDKGNRATGHPTSGTHSIFFRPQSGKGKPGSPAAFMNERRVFH